MTSYTRKQLIELLEIDEGFIVELEREEIVTRDVPEGAAEHYSERMLERARIAHSLISDLDVNLAGASIIVRMREEIEALHREIATLLKRR